METKFVSIIIPCRNEEKYIEKCLNSVISQDYPKENFEILVIDGASEDKTKEIVKNYIAKYSFIQILDNPNKFTPFGLNIGIRASKGKIIIRMDAHAGYEKDYISKCAKYLGEYNADNVGGVIKTLPANDTLEAKAISISLSHPFGAASGFRLGLQTPKEVDTVFGGCYKREVFDKIGFYNENLTRSQDLELNLRLSKAGGKIMLFPDIVAYYYPSSDFEGFFKHNFSDGFWVTYPLKFGIHAFSSRHLIPMVFVLGLIFSFLLFPKSIFLFIFFIYLFASLYFSLKVFQKEKNSKYLILLPLAFACRHFGYGIGSIAGLIRTLF
ncbi:MAG: glycosyltransferase family 2 protein [Candidatus Pacebacteria bacterium]|nr:glycosyltransferase family 2 protein [Candidatus Paceibacterota bacterium]